MAVVKTAIARIASLFGQRVDSQGPVEQARERSLMTAEPEEKQTYMAPDGAWNGFIVPAQSAATYGLGLCADDGVVRADEQIAFDRDVDRIMHGRQQAQSKAGSIRIS
jgi:hypothetical protein